MSPDRDVAVDGDAPPRLPLYQKLIFAAVATVLFVIFVEGLVSVVYAVRDAFRVRGIREETHCDYDEHLGWANRRGIHLPDMYGKGVSLTTNSQGFRSAVGDYTEEVPEGRYRVICLGDSITMGYGVGDGETYPAQMEAMCPELQVVNMGLGGYGIDQDYMWYLREGMKLETDLLLLAFVPENFRRMTTVEFVGYEKPVLEVENGSLVVRNVPVPHTWGTQTFGRRLRVFMDGLSIMRAAGRVVTGAVPKNEVQYDLEGSADLAERVIVELQRMSAEREQHFALAYLAWPPILVDEPTPESKWAEETARRHGIPFVNLVPVFEKLSPAELTRIQVSASDPHYSARGNRIAAENLLAFLRRHFADFPR